MTNDEELQRYMVLIEQYREQINQLEQQSSYIQAAIMDYSKAKITLENINGKDKNDEILVPIGGNTFIHAKTTDTSKVLYNIGAGVITEKNAKDAINKIDEKIEELQRSQDKTAELIQNIENQANEVTEKAQKIINQEKK
jgi:prefoldin alpha subunit